MYNILHPLYLPPAAEVIEVGCTDLLCASPDYGTSGDNGQNGGFL